MGRGRTKRASWGSEDTVSEDCREAAGLTQQANPDVDAPLALQDELQWLMEEPGILQHPRFPELADAIYECQLAIARLGLGCDEASNTATVKCKQAVSEAVAAHQKACADANSILSMPNSSLNAFVDEYIRVASACRSCLDIMHHNLSGVLRDFHQFMAKVVTQPVTLPRSMLVGPTAKQVKREHSHDATESGKDGDQNASDDAVKMYMQQLRVLKQDFCKRRKTGPLPAKASAVLKAWWDSHQKYPYPSEHEKTLLKEETGLDHIQINNWFVNMRKRHWDGPPKDDSTPAQQT